MADLTARGIYLAAVEAACEDYRRDMQELGEQMRRERDVEEARLFEVKNGRLLSAKEEYRTATGQDPLPTREERRDREESALNRARMGMLPRGGD